MQKNLYQILLPCTEPNNYEEISIKKLFMEYKQSKASALNGIIFKHWQGTKSLYYNVALGGSM